ncbi:MAG: alpha-galactosidase [Armatimonadetes bacterium]|nr:alpha-galactosidase [Armatimonadota bacterium]
MTDRGARHLVVELTNQAYSLDVKIHTLLDDTPVQERWVEITNRSDSAVALTKIYPWSGRFWHWIGGNAYDLGYQSNRGLGWFERASLPGGTTAVESMRGPGGFDDPFFIVRNMMNGEYYIAHLAWTANWRMEFTNEQNPSSPDAGLSFRIGPRSANALRVIDPGETITSPSVHLGRVKGDFDSAVQAMHDHIRRFVLPTRPPERSHLIQYVVGGSSETNIRNSIDVAAAVGAELFIIDAGWWDIYGEWTPSPARFPNGIGPLVNYAHSRGLLFGLYAEVEGGRGNWDQSEVYSQHPTWFYTQLFDGERKYFLRLEKPEVAAYMESVLTGLIDQYGLDLYRHDYIPGYTYEGLSTFRSGFVENNYWRYYENYYDVWERIHANHPNLILQMTTCGGAREDLAMMSRFHETYTNAGHAMDTGRSSAKSSGVES